MELLIKNVNIVDSSDVFCGDVYIKNGKIEEIGNLNRDCEILDGEGLSLLPSFVDLHAHFREPGYEYKEDLLSGSMAAVKGGYTAVNLMANTNPPCSNMGIVDYVLDRAKRIDLVDIHQTVTVTKDLLGKDIEHLNTLDERVRFISDDGKGILSNNIMLHAMLLAKKKGLTVISHAEDEEISKIDTRLSENIMTKRDIELAKFTGANLHIAHVSTKEAIEEIAVEKDKGYKITCEVAPHHLFGTSNLNYRVNPPLREKDDIESLIRAIKKGYVDAIATDHAPHTQEDKLKGAPGISGIETAFSICFTKLVAEGHITLNKLIKLMSENPAKMMLLNKGKIKEGYDGDVVLVDLKHKYKIDSSSFVSKGKNNPFDGQEVFGKVIYTIRKGRIVFKG
ncbi:Dihydroorotase [Caloramator mitchellensis]|uniref:Dihydroorotase n=1 Tax=Caloramator mitchellensis TaxID=908809 RepID=A0A0R3JVC9_CALMK|nr:dihydroorotase [Caloramator mitchellensis]KRQ86237.1 Dihydroorotase [Caloramator mitchellensis]